MTALVPDRITSADEQRLAASEAHDAVKVLVDDFRRCAVAIHRGRELEAWRQDDAYQADIAAGRWSDADHQSPFASWAGWLWQRESGDAIGSNYGYRLAQAGEVLEVLALTNGQTPANERQARPLVKLLGVKREGRPLDRDERDEAIRAIWQDAVAHEPTPAEAARKIATYARRYGGPFSNAYGPTGKAADVDREVRRQEKLERLPARVLDLLDELAELDWPTARNVAATMVPDWLAREEAHRADRVTS